MNDRAHRLYDSQNKKKLKKQQQHRCQSMDCWNKPASRLPSTCAKAFCNVNSVLRRHPKEKLLVEQRFSLLGLLKRSDTTWLLLSIFVKFLLLTSTSTSLGARRRSWWNKYNHLWKYAHSCHGIAQKPGDF
jgi:hypothetical protein